MMNIIITIKNIIIAKTINFLIKKKRIANLNNIKMTYNIY